MSFERIDSEALMQRALVLAEGGRGSVAPNPMVGAVLARHVGENRYEIVSEGWHERCGGPHAEVAALEAARRAGVDPRGLTMAVTLEPCAHQGKTPPCADALVRAGIGEAIVATVDPFEAVSGRGIEMLRDAGITVRVGVCEAKAKALIAPFVKRVTRGLPWVIAKWAQTIDGKIATRTGESKWISGPAARRLVHRWRGEVDAVMVGVGTAAADDAELTARDAPPKRIARRIVVDPNCRLPAQAKLLQPGGPPTTVICGRDIHKDLPGHVQRLAVDADTARGGLRLTDALRELVEQHRVTEVLVEGGAKLVGSLLDAELVDELRVFVAPTLLGDAEGLSPVAGPARVSLSEASAWRCVEATPVEADVLLRYVRCESHA
ncbi:MAG: bifunctional diaminohydroxyphosphoribosylaminopyrimidine deaminase/5-amino-6-(5-phosphoribosylamino)uracil reductase RibD [Phycisphaeraceae bacterium]